MNFLSNTCSGGHGISMAVGSSTAAAVSNVLISDYKVSNSLNGIRIKTRVGQ